MVLVNLFIKKKVLLGSLGEISHTKICGIFKLILRLVSVSIVKPVFIQINCTEGNLVQVLALMMNVY